MIPGSSPGMTRHRCAASAYRAVEPLLVRGALDRLLQLLEGAHLNLPHALAADIVLLAQILERGRLLAQPALAEDVAFPLVERAHGLGQQLAALAELLAVGERRFLIVALVHQPILPLALAVLAQRRVEAVVGA